MDFAKLKRFAALTEQCKDMEDKLKAAKAEMDALEPDIIEEMADAGLQNAKINGRTYYIRRSLYAGPAEGFDKVGVALALKQAGLHDYVTETYNSSSLSAYVRSVVKEHEDGEALDPGQIVSLLPAPLQPALYVGEQFKLANRSA